MKPNKVLLLGLVGTAALTFNASDSHAWVGVSLVGGVTHTTPMMKVGGVGYSTTPKLSYLGGVIADFGLTGMTSVEAGVIYSKAKYSGSAGSVRYTVSAPSIQIPVLLRFHPLPLLSFGVGGYYAYRTADATVEEISVSGATLSTDTSKSDYGAVGSVRVHLPVGSRTTFFVDARYLYGLKDLDTTGDEYKMRQAQGLAGLRIGI